MADTRPILAKIEFRAVFLDMALAAGLGRKRALDLAPLRGGFSLGEEGQVPVVGGPSIRFAGVQGHPWGAEREHGQNRYDQKSESRRGRRR